jgi:hypothetical protein
VSTRGRFVRRRVGPWVVGDTSSCVSRGGLRSARRLPGVALGCPAGGAEAGWAVAWAAEGVEADCSAARLAAARVILEDMRTCACPGVHAEE